MREKQQRPVHLAQRFGADDDPLAFMRFEKVNSSLRRLHVALDADWHQTPAQTSLLVLGPPRSSGKTSGTIVPIIFTAPGPVVSTSTS